MVLLAGDMVLFSVIVVLLLEQLRPLPYGRCVKHPVAMLANWVERRFNAGERSNGGLAWCVVVGGFTLLAGGMHVVLSWLNPLLGWLWTIAFLYLTLGFRQFSHYFSGIHLALRLEDLSSARRLLSEWRGISSDGLSASDIARLSIEQALIAAHRHVFGVLACFVLLPGPCGAVLYRLAAELDTVWGQRTLEREDHFSRFARQAFFLIDWVPIRLSALIFSVVGHFEDALFSWRLRGEQSERSLVVTCGAGALGVRLEGGAETNGEPADSGHMQSAVALVWRALLLWLMLLLLLGFAGLFAG